MIKQKIVTAIIYGLISWSLFTGCKDDEVKGKDSGQTAPVRMNTFTEEKMKSVYLWADEIKSRNINRDLDPEIFFDRMMYTAEDKWSRFEHKDEGETADIDGFDHSFGYFLEFYLIGSGEVIAVVCYVYPESPAAKAGLKRGDIILKNNNAYLDKTSLSVMYEAEKLQLKLATLNGTKLAEKQETYTLTRIKTTINPILKDTVIQQNEKKIGYLCYTEFVDNKTNSIPALTEVIGKFRTAGINELILDLRYNLGGYLTAARRLSSLLAPATTVAEKKIIVSKHWNATYQKMYQNISSELEERFDNSAEVMNNKLNLAKIYVIIGSNTASASELVVSSLQPYMDVVLIGERTHGKYVAATAFTPEDNDLKKWTISPIIYAYRNANNVSVKGGISPNIEQEEDIRTMGSLGNPSELLLSVALNQLAGLPQNTLLKARSSATFKVIPNPHNLRKSSLID